MSDFPGISPDDFDLLTEDEQNRYLAILRAEADEWVLFPKQRQALELAEVVDDLLYGGAAGGGKTDLILYHAHEMSLRVSGHRSLLLRSSFPELRRTLIQRAFEKLPVGKGLRWRAADKEWHYSNGSVIEYGYCETLDDARQYLSAEYDLVCIDEASEMPQDVIELVLSRLRTTKAKARRGARPHSVLCTNPGGVGHTFLKENWVDATGFGEWVATEEVDLGGGQTMRRSRAFVQSRVTDNPHVDEQTKMRLASITDPVRRAQMLDGDWSVFSGQFFEGWDRNIHVVPTYKIPDGWHRVRGIDYGFTNPFCSLDVAFNPDGHAVVYREVYQEHLTPKFQARAVLAGQKHKVKHNYADPSVFASTGIGDTVANQWGRAGLTVLRANNQRAPGWAVVREYLMVWPDDKPGLTIMDCCPNLIRTLPQMQRDKDKPEDLNTKLEDHAVDALRYALVHRPPKPRAEQTERTRGLERVREMMRRKQEDAEKRRRRPRTPVS